MHQAFNRSIQATGVAFSTRRLPSWVLTKKATPKWPGKNLWPMAVKSGFRCCASWGLAILGAIHGEISGDIHSDGWGKVKMIGCLSFNTTISVENIQFILFPKITKDQLHLHLNPSWAKRAPISSHLCQCFFQCDILCLFQVGTLHIRSFDVPPAMSWYATTDREMESPKFILKTQRLDVSEQTMVFC